MDSRVSKGRVPFFNTTPENTSQQIEAINYHLKLDFKRTTDQYNRFDAIDIFNNARLECKNRNCIASAYPDTLIGKNKYDCWKEYYKDCDFYVTFMFQDGLYYFKFDKDKTLQEQDLFTTKNRIDKVYNKHANFDKEHINIPVHLLIPLGNSRPITPPIQRGVCCIRL